jgi:NAD(P)-dependent dehydrogenase (short-subunit alcohol dehydrogenase family)
VITGASSGFSLHTARAFAADGWRVYGTMRDPGAPVAAELRTADISVVQLDVTDDASVDAAAHAMLADADGVDVLVNNAGSAFFGIEEAFTPARVEKQFAINAIGPLRVDRAFLPSMRARRRGLVVYLSSTVGRIVIPFTAIYTASKWALEALAEASSYELAPFGIDTAIIEPGAFETGIFSQEGGADDAERAASYGSLAKIAQERTAAVEASSAGRDPKDVAPAILGLANAPAGTRPLRTTVRALPIVDEINAVLAPFQARLIAGLGLPRELSLSSEPTP